MKRTARLVQATGLWGEYALAPVIFGSPKVQVFVENDYTLVRTECSVVLTVLQVPEPLTHAEALARIGYTLEKPPPVLELGEETGAPLEANRHYLLQSDQNTDIMRMACDGFVYDRYGNSVNDAIFTNARWRLITVKETP